MSRQRPPSQTPPRYPAIEEREMRETLENLKEFALMMSFRTTIGHLTILTVEPPRTRDDANHGKAPVLKLAPPGARPSR